VGLTICYEWRTRADVAAAHDLIRLAHNLALELPFDTVSEIFEQDPPHVSARFEHYTNSFRCGDLYLSRRRADGIEETVFVPARHAVFFQVYVQGAESASIGFASHPPVVIHHEDVVEVGSDGTERQRCRGEGDSIEYTTGRRGLYSWQSFCKTQYAGNPKLGGESNFLRAHLSLIELLDQIKAIGVDVAIHDDSEYANHRDVERLLQSLRDWDAIVARVVGQLSDSLGAESNSMLAPIKERPDFEHLEAKGIDLLRRLVARQQERKRDLP
jgi:hypothetical protein